jgi:hypothetical protein
MLVAAILQHQRSEDHQVTERENELVPIQKHAFLASSAHPWKWELS